MWSDCSTAAAESTCTEITHNNNTNNNNTHILNTFTAENTSVKLLMCTGVHSVWYYRYLKVEAGGGGENLRENTDCLTS